MRTSHLNQPRYRIAVLGIAAMPVLFFISRYNYNLFHSLVDGASIVIAVAVFMIIWNARLFLDNDYFLYVGISFLFFAFLDFIHVLGNKNMGVFPTHGNLGPALYIASRYVISISFLVAPLFVKRKLNTSLVFTVYSLVTAFILLSIFYWRICPVCIVEGVGLTPFKVISDYIVCLILLGSIGLLFVNRGSFDSRVFWLIVSSIVLSIATGVAFTLYADPFGITNAVGHFFQIGSFGLVYVAIIETSLTKPQDILYRKLKRSEEKLVENVKRLDHANAELNQEITDRKQAEGALRESEEKYRSLFENMAEEVHFWRLVRDESGWIKTWRLVEANPPTLKTWGKKSIDEIKGKTADEIFGPGATEHYLPAVQKIITEAVPHSFEDYFPNLDKYFRFTSVPFGEYFITTGADITAIKKAEEAMRQLNEKLEQQVAERTQLAEERAKKLQTLVGQLTLAEQRERQRLAKILHDELQQLLVGVKMNGEMLPARIGEGQKQIVENILDLIGRSIQISRSLTAELSPPVLDQGLSATFKWLGRQMQQIHGLEVEIQTDSDIDPQREGLTLFLYQSMRELLLNVLKHAGTKSARIEMTHQEPDQLRVTVSDHGRGFDPAGVWKVQENRFGLFSIRERLELMGGSIEVESSPGNGAALSLIVPMEAKKEQHQKSIRKIMAKVHSAKRSGNKIRVLIADDHAGVRDGLSTQLNLHSDIEVTGVAVNGEEAIEKAQELQPDVILMDISMPKMDGITATQIINSELPHIRIIGLSMHDKQDQADLIIQAGASAYCTKDGDIDTLLHVIRARRGSK